MTDDLILQAREMQKRMIATTLPGELADALEAQTRRIAALEATLREAYEVYAGSDGFIAETAAEGYLQQLIGEMVAIIGAGLKK